MKKITLVFTAIVFSINVFSQPTIQWQKCLGGTGIDEALSVQQTFDGGCIVAGYTTSNDGDVTNFHAYSDFWVVKLNSSGNLQWQKCLGGTGDERANCVIQTTDGGYMVAGFAASSNGDVIGNHGSYDYWIIKLDGSGNIQWQKCLGGIYNDYANSIQQTMDGGYIVAGYSASNDGDVTGNHGSGDYWLVKLDNSGNIQWQKCLGGTNVDFANSVQQTVDGGYIVAGNTTSNNGDVSGLHVNGINRDYWIVKLDSSGNLQWQKCLGGSLDERANSVQQTADGGYVAAGYTPSNDGDVTGLHVYGNTGDCWIVKLSGSGNIQWQKCLGGTNNDEAYSVRQIADGSYIVAAGAGSSDGDVTGNHGLTDYWLANLDTNGNLQWQKCFGGTGNEVAISFEQTTDGGYIVAGYTISNDGDVTGWHGSYDYWIVKLSPFVGMEEETNNFFVNIFPNPATNVLTIENGELRIEKVELYNAFGEKVFSQISPEVSGFKSQISVDVSQLVPGVYFVALTDDKGNKMTKRFVKM